ncbi:hypothetical protein COCOBI_11-0570 [Coccomyxa sp. Obi]|nr:hypothetical protein COCOBI_11-0570 [Coccomyxa sp. Obi]
MEEIKKQILGFTDWDASHKGRVLNHLKGDNIERFTGLPDDVLQADLDDELSGVFKEAIDTRSFSQDLTDFWAALPKADYDPTTRFLRLPKGVYFLGDQRYGQVVYVRNAYDELTAFILEMQPRPPPEDTDLVGPAVSSNRLLVTGLPGSGKTFYNFPLMKELASRHATVVVDWASRDDERILFTSNGAYLGIKSSFKKELRDPATYFLVDSKAPPEVGAITIETCSPSHEKTWSELEKALPLFPAVSPTLLRRRFKKWGGTIRWCLERANDPSSEQALEAGIAATNFQALLAAVGNPDEAATVLDRILHMIPDLDLNRSHYVFASKYVEERVVSELMKSHRADLEIFLISSTGISELAVVPRAAV